jgi:hypothetical protein
VQRSRSKTGWKASTIANELIVTSVKRSSVKFDHNYTSSRFQRSMKPPAIQCGAHVDSLDVHARWS